MMMPTIRPSSSKKNPPIKPCDQAVWRQDGAIRLMAMNTPVAIGEMNRMQAIHFCHFFQPHALVRPENKPIRRPIGRKDNATFPMRSIVTVSICSFPFKKRVCTFENIYITKPEERKVYILERLFR